MNLGEIGFDRLLEIAAPVAYLIVLLWIGLRSARQVRPEQSENHWLDCLVGSAVAASND